jgi:hypothetical protein
MKAVRYLLVFVLLTIFGNAHAQFTDRFWAFGDSAAIDFSNINNPHPSVSALCNRGTCTSICDSTGRLLFYAGASMYIHTGNYFQGFVVNKDHQVMDNGLYVAGEDWYQGMIIVPDPGNINRFYLFSIMCLGPNEGLFYSIIDMTYNSGLGKVVQKNVNVFTDNLTDCIAAVRHGNGRDWWIVIRASGWDGYGNMTVRDEYYFYLVTPSGISNPIIQHLGVPVSTDCWRRMKFNKDGSKFFAINWYGTFDVSDFDRCTGLVTNTSNLNVNNVVIHPWSFALSANENVLYLSTTSNKFIQYDLTASNMFLTADTLIDSLGYNDQMGLVQTGPDGKVYLSSQSAIGLNQFSTIMNNNLSVVNYPDSLGASCDFQPYSFNLGSGHTMHGLPTFPNYSLGRLVGSNCDTLTVGIQNLSQEIKALNIYYNSYWSTAFVNAKKLKGRKYQFDVFTVDGQLLIQESGIIDNEYFTKDLNMTSLSDGVYVVRLITDKEVLTGKFVKR